MTPTEQARHLMQHGYVVVMGVDAATLRGKLEAMMMEAPEFQHHPPFNQVGGDDRYVCGGTAFVGTPTVFHGWATRKWHHDTARQMMPMIQTFAELSGIPNVKLARGLFDRIQIRPPGESAKAESFHRDLPGMVEVEREICIGGFQNCDLHNQKLCAVKGSHTVAAAGGQGFSPIDKAGQKEYAARLKAQANQHDTDAKGRIIVPPGHLILFFSNIVHAVNAATVPYTSVKIFFGFRLTAADNTGMVGIDKKRLTYEELETRMVANDVIPLGSGQTPAFYPGMYHVIPKMLPIAQRVVAKMLVPGAMRVPFEKANARHDYTRATTSLEAMGVQKHRPYDETEFACIRPQSTVMIKNYDTGVIETFPLKRARIEIDLTI